MWNSLNPFFLCSGPLQSPSFQPTGMLVGDSYQFVVVVVDDHGNWTPLPSISGLPGAPSSLPGVDPSGCAVTPPAPGAGPPAGPSRLLALVAAWVWQHLGPLGARPDAPPHSRG